VRNVGPGLLAAQSLELGAHLDLKAVGPKAEFAVLAGGLPLAITAALTPALSQRE
jgi:hypothetical protein